MVKQLVLQFKETKSALLLGCLVYKYLFCSFLDFTVVHFKSNFCDN